MTDADGNPVAGSLLFNSQTGEMTFIPTNPLLNNGPYTITVVESDVLTSQGSVPLGSGSRESTVNVDSTNPVVSIPGFARGPGQAVDLGIAGTGLPVRISDATGLTRVRFTIDFDSSLLAISNVELAAAIPGDWTVTHSQFSAGRLIIDASGITPLTSAN